MTDERPDTTASRPLRPEVVDGGAGRDAGNRSEGNGADVHPPDHVTAALAGRGDDGAARGDQVTSPAKLVRIASMVRAMLDEVRRAPLDDAGRRRLREIHDRSVGELESILSDDLRAELGEVVLPFTADAPSEPELRIAQAQLVGWLEGLFHGIQATLFTQQMQAQRQFEEMRARRALEPHGADRPPGTYI